MSTFTNTNNETIIKPSNMADSMPNTISSRMEDTSTSIPTHQYNSEEKIQLVPSNVLGSASAMAAAGNDSWSTPLSQYEGFKPLLDALSCGNRLKIWDPFYFNGTAAKYMAQVFKNNDVIHEDRKVDLVPFQLPAFAAGTELIFTNPPFSIAKQVLEWMLSLKIPFIACLPVAVATNKGTNPMIREHKIQIIKSNGRIAFELSESPEDSPTTGKRDTAWYCYGLSLPAEVQWWYVGLLEGEMGNVRCLGNSNRKRKRHCQTDQNANANKEQQQKLQSKEEVEEEKEEEKCFKDWFDMYCGTTNCDTLCLGKTKEDVKNSHERCHNDEHFGRAIKVHVRKKAPHSWEKYCTKHGIIIPKKHAKDDFEAKLKEEMGDALWGDTFHQYTTIGRKKCYDHIFFKCCSNYPHKNLLCPEVPTTAKKKNK